MCMAVGGSELPVVIVMVVNSSWLLGQREKFDRGNTTDPIPVFLAPSPSLWDNHHVGLLAI